MQVKFKNADCEKEFYEMSPALSILAYYFISLSNKLGVVPVVTRVMEKVSGETGIHQKGRAIDFRCEVGVGGEMIYTPLQIETIVSEMNEKFGSKYMVACLYHAFVNPLNPEVRGPYHFHVQASVSQASDPQFIKDFGYLLADNQIDA